MSAKHAVLGMLRDGPAHPYQLAARIQDLLGPGYDIHSGQMSQIMRRLAEQELVEPVEVEPRLNRRGEDRRVVYAITSAGDVEFEKFFETPSEGAQLFRRGLLVKIALAGPERLSEVLDQIDTYEQDCTNRINDLIRALDAVLPDDQPRPRADRVVLRLSLEADVSQLRAELAWARHAREMVSWLLRSDAIWPSRNRSRTSGDPAQARREDARQQLFSRLAARDRGD